MKQINKGIKLNNKHIKYDKPSFYWKFNNKSKLKDQQKEYFYLELHSMLEAGIDIKKSFDVFIHQQKNNKDKELLINLQNRIINGSSLSDSMMEAGVFSSYEYHCIKIGEETGMLFEVLIELATFYTGKLKIKKQLIKSLSYPLVILIISVCAVSFMMAFVVPMFSDIFKRFDGELPVITKFFISFSNGVSTNGGIIFFTLFFLILLCIKLLKRKKIMNKLQCFYIKIPVLGSLILSIYIARFFSSMSLLLGAKVPLLNAIQLVKKMIDFYPLQKLLDQTENEILKGRYLYDCLNESTFFDEKIMAMIRIGEEVNKLPSFFNKLYQKYADDVELKSSAINTFLEPLIIIVLGLVVGLILISMYLPMFKLSTSIGM